MSCPYVILFHDLPGLLGPPDLLIPPVDTLVPAEQPAGAVVFEMPSADCHRMAQAVGLGPALLIQHPAHWLDHQGLVLDRRAGVSPFLKLPLQLLGPLVLPHPDAPAAAETEGQEQRLEELDTLARQGPGLLHWGR